MVDKELRVVHIELRNELLYIARVGCRAHPLLVDSFKQPVGVVKSAALELNHPLGVTAHKESNYIAGAAVMCPKQVPLIFRQLIEAFNEVLEPFGFHSPHRLTQVAENRGVL